MDTQSIALWAIRILRQIPHTAAFDVHLTNCAAMAVFYGPAMLTEPLRLFHVLRMARMPDFLLSLDQRTAKGVEIPSITRFGEFGSFEDPETLGGTKAIHQRFKTVH